MKFTPEQQVVWFYTAFFVLAEANLSVEEAVEQWLREYRAKSGRERSEMLSGLRQGINDTLVGARHSREVDIVRTDRALTEKGLPTIRKMAAALGKKHPRILKRGFIKDDEEFYIVAEILSDVDFDISDADRAKLGKISYAYETRAK